MSEKMLSAGKGALFLTALSAISQVLGFFYRVVLSRLVGAEVMGLYQLVMPVSSVIMSLTAVGLTSAVSNLTSQHLALGNRRAADQTLSTCLKIFFLLLLPVGAVVVLGSDAISVYLLGDARTQLGLILLVPCVALTGVENIHKVGAIGVPGYQWETKIVDEQWNEVPQGEIGELAVKGPGVMLCYYKNPEATAEILKDGWLYTGDMARMDGDGFIFLVDRKKDVVISGGENIYPVQIEDFLRKFDKIKDVAVIGLPEPRLGEIAAAIIEVKEGVPCTEAEIDAFCRELPRYKRPRRIIFDKVPRNPTGKIEKPVLREKYCHGRLVEAQITR